MPDVTRSPSIEGEWNDWTLADFSAVIGSLPTGACRQSIRPLPPELPPNRKQEEAE
jgi:hypothetical protein